jgi:pimeloyl-ACP methyl ester carboxylesterase
VKIILEKSFEFCFTKQLIQMKKAISVYRRVSKSFIRIVVIPVLMLAIAIPLVSCSKGGDQNQYPQKTFILVHGAFQAAYAWNDVKAQLISKGQKVVIIELPGHGSDTTSPSLISLNSYRDKVIAAINATTGNVVLVGHSMGGMVISAVAEAMPGRIEKLIYVGAFVPQNGQSLFQIASQDKEGQLGPLLVPSKDFLTLTISDTTKIPDVFCADGSTQVKQLLLANYKPEPAKPFNDIISLTSAAFGSVSKIYIHTSNDKALGITLQNKMVSDAGISKVYSINSSHCPHLSMPEVLSALLLTVAQ